MYARVKGNGRRHYPSRSPTLVFSRPLRGFRVGQESPGHCCTTFSHFAEPGAIKHVCTTFSLVSPCLGFDTPHYSLQCWFSAFCIVYLRVKVNGRRHFSSRSGATTSLTPWVSDLVPFSLKRLSRLRWMLTSSTGPTRPLGYALSAELG